MHYRVQLEEGYDLHDSRYAQWLSTLPTVHCNSATENYGGSSNSGYALKQQSTLKKFLHVPTPPAQRKSTKYVNGGCEECLHEAQEKEESKKQKDEDRRKKAKERQIKAKER